MTNLANKHDGKTAAIKYVFDFKAGDWDINLATGVTGLGSSITDSSIVDDDDSYHAAIS